MANRTYGAKTICPFYLKEAGKSITCEGLVAGTMSMTRFATEYDKRMYQESTCEMYNYEHFCPLAEALMRKYDDAT